MKVSPHHMIPYIKILRFYKLSASYSF